jgi:hypothetical protein
MSSRRAFSEQLALPFRAAGALPYAVSPRAKGDPVKLLRMLRKKYRQTVRGQNAAAYASSPEGRRAHAALDELVMKLCG